MGGGVTTDKRKDTGSFDGGDRGGNAFLVDTQNILLLGLWCTHST